VGPPPDSPRGSAWLRGHLGQRLRPPPPSGVTSHRKARRRGQRGGRGAPSQGGVHEGQSATRRPRLLAAYWRPPILGWILTILVGERRGGTMRPEPPAAPCGQELGCDWSGSASGGLDLRKRSTPRRGPSPSRMCEKRIGSVYVIRPLPIAEGGRRRPDPVRRIAT
jgi:hypothetical protein